MLDVGISQIHNNWLSTFKAPKLDRAQLLSLIEKLLSKPFNYENREGKT